MMESVLGLTRGYTTATKTGVTSSAPAVLYNLAAGAMVRLYPTSAGTATFYSTGSNPASAATDVAAGNSAITSSATAKWTQWTAGAVTADTTQTAILPQSAGAVVVTSGTWTLEVCQ